MDQQRKEHWWQCVEISSDEEYNQVTDKLASELLRENTPEQLAVIAAQHLIYVDALETSSAERMERIRVQEEIVSLQKKLLLNAAEELQTKLSVKEVARISKIALESWKVRNIQKRISGLSLVNGAKAAVTERAKAIAVELWQADSDQEYRLFDMAKVVEGALKHEGLDNLPTIERIKEWIKPVAPDYARKGGRRRKTP